MCEANKKGLLSKESFSWRSSEKTEYEELQTRLDEHFVCDETADAFRRSRKRANASG